MDDEVIILQEMVAHQGMDIALLSDELRTQQKEIARLNNQIEALHAKFRAAADDENSEQEPPPPHY